MGTNYYVRRNKPADLSEFCKTFNNDWDSFVTQVQEIESEGSHVGKCSAGWRFLFHESEHFRTYPEFEKFIKSVGKKGKYQDYYIENEYGEKVKAKDLLKTIEEHQKQPFRNGDGSPALQEPSEYRTVVRDGYRFSGSTFS